MSNNVTLKNLYGEKKAYQGIDVISVPNANGTDALKYVTAEAYTLSPRIDGATLLYGETVEQTSVLASSVISGELTVTVAPGANNKIMARVDCANGSWMATEDTKALKNVLIFTRYDESATTIAQKLFPEYALSASFTTQTGYPWGFVEIANGAITGYHNAGIADGYTISVKGPVDVSDYHIYNSLFQTSKYEDRLIVANYNSTGYIAAETKPAFGLLRVQVNVKPHLQEKTAQITENGTTEVSADSGYDGLSKVTITTSVSGGADISDFGDAGGNGSVIVLPNSGGIDVYCKCQSLSILDSGYPDWLTQIIILSPNVIAALNSFASSLITDHTEFDAIFSDASKALFMDSDHPCDIPAFSENTAKSWDGLRGVLYESIKRYNDFYRNDFINYTAYTRTYIGNQIEDGIINVGDKITFPFVWYSAEANGSKIAGYLSNTPTGDMPTYESVYKVYGSLSSQFIGFCNANADYGISYNVICAFSGEIYLTDKWILFSWYSYGEQTIPAAVLTQLIGQEWSYGDVPLVDGWNATIRAADAEGNQQVSTIPITIEELQSAMTNAGVYFDASKINYSTMSDYEKSALEAHYVAAYKRKGTKSFSITLNVVCEDTSTNNS